MIPVDDIYKAIRDEIFVGNLNPEERLIEKELCECLGMSLCEHSISDLLFYTSRTIPFSLISMNL
jgi:hypothetical protein